MKKSLAAAGLVASLALGGMGLGVSGVAGAAETATGAATGAAGSVQEVLRGLVGGGTITQEQADAVQAALKEARAARPERGAGHPGRGGHKHMSVVAEALGVTPEELHTALQNDQTIAQVAQAKGIDVGRVVSAIVAAEKAKVDAAVASGRLTQERADAALANAEARATAMVNGERPPFGGRGGGPRR